MYRNAKVEVEECRSWQCFCLKWNQVCHLKDNDQNEQKPKCETCFVKIAKKKKKTKQNKTQKVQKVSEK